MQMYILVLLFIIDIETPGSCCSWYFRCWPNRVFLSYSIKPVFTDLSGQFLCNLAHPSLFYLFLWLLVSHSSTKDTNCTPLPRYAKFGAHTCSSLEINLIGTNVLFSSSLTVVFFHSLTKQMGIS